MERQLPIRLFDEGDNELEKFTKLIERMFKLKIAKNTWMQPCPENNKFDRFLNSFPTTLVSHQTAPQHESATKKINQSE